MLDDPDIFESLIRVICPTAPYVDGAGLFLCAIARVCTTWRDGVAAKLQRTLGCGEYRRLSMFDVLPAAPRCAAELAAYHDRLKRVRDHFLVSFMGGPVMFLELQMDCTHRDVVVQAHTTLGFADKLSIRSGGMLSECTVVQRWARGPHKKNITQCGGGSLGCPRVEAREFIGTVIDPLILGVLLHKQSMGPKLEPRNYGGVWTFPSAASPPCPPRLPEPTFNILGGRRRPPEVPDQNYVDPRGDVVFSCIFNTVKKMPKAAVAAVVPSVDIHFIPRPHWSDRKLCELLEYMQSFPSLRGARPYLVGEGGIEMPQSDEQRRAFGAASKTFDEKATAHVRGFSMSHYSGPLDQWRDYLLDDSPWDGWLARDRGYISSPNASSETCPAMRVRAKCGPTLQQMRDVMSALEACGHLLIATNLTRVGPFGIKAQQFYTSTELGAMTGHVSELAY